MGNGASEAYHRALQDSLATIRRAHEKLHLAGRSGVGATSSTLKSRVELYGVLLGEVAGIRRNLTAHLEGARTQGQIQTLMERVNRSTIQETSSL